MLRSKSLEEVTRFLAALRTETAPPNHWLQAAPDEESFFSDPGSLDVDNEPIPDWQIEAIHHLLVTAEIDESNSCNREDEWE